MNYDWLVLFVTEVCQIRFHFAAEEQKIKNGMKDCFSQVLVLLFLLSETMPMSSIHKNPVKQSIYLLVFARPMIDSLIKRRSD